MCSGYMYISMRPALAPKTTTFERRRKCKRRSERSSTSRTTANLARGVPLAAPVASLALAFLVVDVVLRDSPFPGTNDTHTVGPWSSRQ